MWKLFKPREHLDRDPTDESHEACLKQMKTQLDSQLKHLIKMFKDSETFLSLHAHPTAAQ